jgi:hypothetical protein
MKIKPIGVRVFAAVDDIWLMQESYHTYIDTSPIMTAVDTNNPGDQRQDLRNIDLSP